MVISLFSMYSVLIITSVRFLSKKIFSCNIIYSLKYYTRKICKSSYLYIKRLLPEGIIHFRKSDTFYQKPIIQQGFKPPHCFNIQMFHSKDQKTHVHYLSLLSHKPQKIKVSLKADKRFQYSPEL